MGIPLIWSSLRLAPPIPVRREPRTTTGLPMQTRDEGDVITQDPSESTELSPSRRRFFALGATAAAALATGRAVTAQPPKGRTNPFPNNSADASRDWRDPLLRLVRRITMGLAPEEVALARRLGYAGYLEYQLNPTAIDDGETDNFVALRTPFTGLVGAALLGSDGNEAAAQLSDAALYRAAFSKRQLKERMVEFWTDHFTISINKVGNLKLMDDRDVIRANALGTFPQLLKATSQSAAMLVYLDQNRSSTPTPNQNYAREIMELHTLGVDGGYTQTDVAELSRILTGYSTTNIGGFNYIRNAHDRGAKTFLGRAFPAMPATATDAQLRAEAETAIQMLVDHASTARYIAWKMSRWLLSYDPPQSVVDATAAAYTASGGDIPTMIRTILTSQNLLASPAKYKRPFHLAASSLRAMGATAVNIRPARQQADVMGQAMFMWEQPNGYPDRVDWWSGLVLQRWNYMAYVSQQASTTTLNVNTAPFRTPDTADGVVNQIASRMFGDELPPVLRSQLSTYLKGGTYNEARVRETIGLAASANQFQWY